MAGGLLNSYILQIIRKRGRRLCPDGHSQVPWRALAHVMVQTPLIAKVLKSMQRTQRPSSCWETGSTARRISFHERESVWHEVRENVGVQHDDRTDDGAERDRVPHDEAKDVAFISHLLSSRGRDSDGLRVHHFSHHTAGAVGRAHQNRVNTELL